MVFNFVRSQCQVVRVSLTGRMQDVGWGCVAGIVTGVWNSGIKQAQFSENLKNLGQTFRILWIKF